MTFEQLIRTHYDCRAAPRGELAICCPACGDRKFHGRVNPHKGLYYCYRCSLGCGAIRFLLRFQGFSLSRARSVVGEKTSIVVAPTSAEVEVLPEIDLPAGARPLYGERRCGQLGQDCRAYWERRFPRDSRDLALDYQIHYALPGVLIFPFFDPQLRLVYYQSRFIAARTARYASMPGTKYPFGLDRVAAGSTVILVEGVTDAITVGSGAVALLGADLVDRFVDWILECRPGRLIVATDPDKYVTTSLEAGKKLQSRCEAGSVYFVDPAVWLRLDNADPADLGSRARSIIVDHAIPFDPGVFHLCRREIEGLEVGSWGACR